MGNSAITELKNFYRDQQGEWSGLRDGIGALGHVQEKQITIAGDIVRIQFNPLRAVNVTAKVADAVDTGSCFLCEQMRPKEQRALQFGKDFLVLCNPRPIFKEHFTVTYKNHRPQELQAVYDDFLALAKKYPGYAVFYNGAKSGASAPFHLHFQLVPQSSLPLCSLPTGQNTFAGVAFTKNINLEKSNQAMLNVIAYTGANGTIQVASFDRKAHRPKAFFEDRLIVSPACVELGGVWVTVREKDFTEITANQIQEVLSEVV